MNSNEALAFLESLENGSNRIINQDYSLNIENKKKILEIFPILNIQKINSHPFEWNDKIPLLQNHKKIRTVPGSIIRKGVYIGYNCIIMPAFINIGAYIGENTMIDSYATIGSCAYIGRDCHISSSSVIAGVLEPPSALPVIIEDNVFIGAQCLISEGVRIKSGTTIAAGTTITASTKIFDRETGKQVKEIPANSLVVPSSYKSGEFYIKCALVAKKEYIKSQNTSINDVLRSL